MYRDIIQYGETWDVQLRRTLKALLLGILRLDEEEERVQSVVKCVVDIAQEEVGLEEEIVSEIDASLDQIFEEECEDLNLAEDMSALLLMATSVIDRLISVQRQLVPIFPPSYQILDKYLSASHRVVTNSILIYIRKSGIHQLDMDESLNLLAWSSDFSRAMKEYGYEDLGREFEDVAQELRERFIFSSAEKMRDWLENIFERERDNMEVVHIQKPREDSGVQLVNISNASSDIAVCLRNQLNLTMERLKGQVVADVSSLILIQVSSHYLPLLDKWLNEQDMGKQLGVEDLSILLNNAFHLSNLLNQLATELFSPTSLYSAILPQDILTQCEDCAREVAGRCVSWASLSIAPFVIQALMEEVDEDFSFMFIDDWLMECEEDPISLFSEDYQPPNEGGDEESHPTTILMSTLYDLLSSLDGWLLSTEGLFHPIASQAFTAIIEQYLTHLIGRGLTFSTPSVHPAIQSDLEFLEGLSVTILPSHPPGLQSLLFLDEHGFSSPVSQIVEMIPSFLPIFGSSTTPLLKAVVGMKPEVEGDEYESFKEVLGEKVEEWDGSMDLEAALTLNWDLVQRMVQNDGEQVEKEANMKEKGKRMMRGMMRKVKGEKTKGFRRSTFLSKKIVTSS